LKAIQEIYQENLDKLTARHKQIVAAIETQEKLLTKFARNQEKYEAKRRQFKEEFGLQ
jgi:hypothetical protein